MSVLLIAAPNSIRGYVTPQLGVLRLAHLLRKRGFDCDLFDPEIDDLASFPAGTEYDLIALSGNHSAMGPGLDLAEKFLARQKKKPLLAVGGLTPTYNCRDWLEAGFDVVMLGYGEWSLPSLAQAAESGRPVDPSALPALAWLDGERLVQNPAPPLTADFFEQITFRDPADLDIPYQRYWDFNSRILQQLNAGHHNFIIRTVRLFTSSQCPNRCGYCPSKFLARAQGSPARRFALRPEQVLEQIRQNVAKYEADMVFFNDDEFLCDKKAASALCALIIEDKKSGRLPAGLKFECQSRAVDFLVRGQADRELLSLLDRAGFNRISLGVENISARLLATPVMNKAQYTRQEVEALVEAFQETGMALQVNFMLLVPETTPDELRENLAAVMTLIRRRVLINLNLYILAFPGAPAVESGSYEMVYQKIVSPLNGRELEIPHHYQLQNQELRTKLTDLDQLFAREKEKYLTRLGSGEERFSNTGRALISCLALAGALGDGPLHDEFGRLLEELG